MVFEIGARLLAESAPNMFISAPVVEVPRVLVEYVQPAPVVEYGAPCFSLCFQRLALHCTLNQRDVTETSCCMLSKSFQELFNVVWKLENTVPPVIVLSFH